MSGVHDGLAAASAQFEQMLLADMLRAACTNSQPSLGDADDADDDSGDTLAAGTTASFQDLYAQALAASIERAGGIGFARAFRRVAE
ncbi:MAG TPA: hypothetical protein VEJ20_04215 [Candidatus Eremiobacteraceae bacterium]|nr:hypothetical protein [Candidatus Eremiobacteraceae bacterium]